MEDLYSIHPGISRAISGDRSDLLKSQIANHPRYPSLLSAYIECRKVGAPPEMAKILEEIRDEDHRGKSSHPSPSKVGADPELDEFMDSYCAILEMYKEEISRPFDEAAMFLNGAEAQLRKLCSGCTTNTNNNTSDEAVGSSEEELSYGDVGTLESQDVGSSSVGDHELKERLLKKYSGYLSSLRKEFMKKRKKGKLPKDARLTLLEWWNAHYQWPYPTEEEKARLAEITGLDPKQINNWFINQRKRHWKPSEDMRFALMEGATLHFDTATVGPGTTFLDQKANVFNLPNPYLGTYLRDTKVDLHV